MRAEDGRIATRAIVEIWPGREPLEPLGLEVSLCLR